MITYILIFFGVLIAFLILYWLGFRVKPRATAPDLEKLEPPETTPLAGEDLPAPLRAYFKSTFGENLPLPGTAVAWGTGRIVVRYFGALGPLWAPLRWAVYLVPGEQFVWRTTITWFRQRMLQGGDEFRQGHGRFVMGNRPLENKNINLSEWAVMWLYTLFAAPTSLLGEDTVQFDPVDENAVRMRVPAPGKDEHWEFILRFEPDSSRLYKIETKRTASRSGEGIPYQIWLYDPQNHPVGRLPSTLRFAWEGEDHLELKVSGVAYNLNINPILEHGANEAEAYTPPDETPHIENTEPAEAEVDMPKE
jgi:hypothetical protein